MTQEAQNQNHQTVEAVKSGEAVKNAEAVKNVEVVMSGYLLLGGLGRGNTSRVYLAEKVAGPDITITAPNLTAPNLTVPVRAGKRVALKVPLPDTLADHAAAERFANEVRLTLQFRHPHLVAGLDGTAFGPDTFLAMHHYPGGTLARQLSQGPLPLNAALQVLADVASGMAYLHHAGAVHQDVKTQNVYLEEGEVAGVYRAALGDFGSTYFQAQGGQVSGSPFYMAPEVYQGEMTGPPSDVYSFGVLAYELLSGERPHRGDSYESLMVSHMTHFAPPLNIGGLPRGLARLLETALAKRPGDRPQSSRLRRALLESLGHPDEAQSEYGEHPDAASQPGTGTSSGGTQGSGTPPPGDRPPRDRSSVGRHGPDVPVVQRSAGPAGASATPRPASGKRGWNPFRKK